MAEHRALRAAGGARRVEGRRQIVVLAGDRFEAAGLGARQRGQGTAVFATDRLDGAAVADEPGDRCCVGGIAHDQRRLRVVEEILQLARDIGGVQRQ